MADTNEDQTQQDELFELEDVEVDTLGLVERGAVQETFFLLKNEAGELVTEDGLGLNDLERLGAQRIQELVAKGLAAEQAERMEPSTDDDEPEAPAADDPENKEVQKDDEVNAMSEKEKKVDEATTPDEGGGDTVTKSDQPVAAEVPQTELAKMQAQLEAMQAEIAKADEIRARLEKAETDLAKAQQQAANERDARELILHIDKAQKYDTLGISADELGAFFHSLAKADATANIEKSADAEDRQDLLGYIEGVLKAANEQVKQSKFFDEAGTVGSVNKGHGGETDIVAMAKALQEESGGELSFRDALLQMPETEQRAHLANVKVKRQ